MQKEFSYFSDPDALREVWSDSIRRWSKYPEVIWQLGLRGRGDRPFWEAGSAPETDEGRAAVIAAAIREQKELVLLSEQLSSSRPESPGTFPAASSFSSFPCRKAQWLPERLVPE